MNRIIIVSRRHRLEQAWNVEVMHNRLHGVKSAVLLESFALKHDFAISLGPFAATYEAGKVINNDSTPVHYKRIVVQQKTVARERRNTNRFASSCKLQTKKKLCHINQLSLKFCFNAVLEYIKLSIT